MKLLIVAMRSIHTKRWLSQLKDSGIEVHWFDILNGGYMKELGWVHQHTDWRWRFGNFKGRYWIKKKLPFLHRFLEKDANKEFERIIVRIQPDAVQSIALHICAYPILQTMRYHHNIPWIYSAWGSDLFYHQKLRDRCIEIEHVLPHINFMFADCQRDMELARNLGFEGKSLGVFPGGGGFNLKKYNSNVKNIEERDIIIVKGYEDDPYSKGLNAVKAAFYLPEEIKSQYQLIIFSADSSVINFVENNFSHSFKSVKIIPRKSGVSHETILKYFGMSIAYIGNSLSDGMPNTLLEAIIMGAFPLQSNPGGVTEEIIINGKNGFLIDDPENIISITNLLRIVLNDKSLIRSAHEINQSLKYNFDFEYLRSKLIGKYKQVLDENN